MELIVIKLLMSLGIYFGLGIIFVIILATIMIIVEYKHITKHYKKFDKDAFVSSLKHFYDLKTITFSIALWPAVGIFTIGYTIWLFIETNISKINLLEIIANKLEKMDKKRNPQKYI
jgi:hypothetical protein